MEIAGLCNICGKPIASFSCILCGNIVCRNCYDQKNGICIKCNLK
jgi:hypothetical protein